MSTGDSIPGFPFKSNYATIDGVRLHSLTREKGLPF